MEILVFIKQVPDDSVEIHLNQNTNMPALDDVTPVVNAFDTYALEMAVRLKEVVGGKVTVATIGDEKSNDGLKNCLSVGADNAFRVTDSVFDDSDSLATGYVLASMVPKIEESLGTKFDVIFCGKETTDCTTGQVGPQLAYCLNLPAITNIIDINLIENKISAKQETDEGYNIVEAAIPCVVTVTKPTYDPRYATMKTKMAARKVEIPVMTNSEIGVDSSKIGGTGSKVRVLGLISPAKKEAGVKIIEKTPQEAVSKAISFMTDSKVL